MTIDGNWEVSMNTPMGEQHATVELTSNGDVLQGKIVKSALGSEESFAGTISGNDIAFSVPITKPMPMTLAFTATIDGDNISGEVALGAFGKAPLTGKRV